jgi:hypothetical protein
MSDNSEIQIIWHLRRVVPRPKSFNFYQEKASSMEQTDLMDNHWGITYPVSYRRGPR